MKNNKISWLSAGIIIAVFIIVSTVVFALRTVSDEPQKVTWTGEIITQMESYNAYALKIKNGDNYYDMFYAQPFEVIINSDGSLSPFYNKGDIITITGEWKGITCAYQDSIFQGKCVPDIEIQSIIK
jgi:hypothetical protein